ncbi:hypothetical protein EVJ58_g4882 [Rhodofomes roseus]|uniref:Uncharacterized protein n=1 Tax=Rhodofomes roseus TaxID=34475 RepID=A0A4Y9YE85_9APHY|nr:hypothetical protein EVJ58_g4882 [Rhodofomes roseus]
MTSFPLSSAYGFQPEYPGAASPASPISSPMSASAMDNSFPDSTYLQATQHSNSLFAHGSSNSRTYARMNSYDSHPSNRHDHQVYTSISQADHDTLVRTRNNAYLVRLRRIEQLDQEKRDLLLYRTLYEDLTARIPQLLGMAQEAAANPGANTQTTVVPGVAPWSGSRVTLGLGQSLPDVPPLPPGIVYRTRDDWNRALKPKAARQGPQPEGKNVAQRFIEDENGEPIPGAISRLRKKTYIDPNSLSRRAIRAKPECSEDKVEFDDDDEDASNHTGIPAKRSAGTSHEDVPQAKRSRKAASNAPSKAVSTAQPPAQRTPACVPGDSTHDTNTSTTSHSTEHHANRTIERDRPTGTMDCLSVPAAANPRAASHHLATLADDTGCPSLPSEQEATTSSTPGTTATAPSPVPTEAAASAVANAGTSIGPAVDGARLLQVPGEPATNSHTVTDVVPSISSDSSHTTFVSVRPVQVVYPAAMPQMLRPSREPVAPGSLATSPATSPAALTTEAEARSQHASMPPTLTAAADSGANEAAAVADRTRNDQSQLGPQAGSSPGQDNNQPSMRPESCVPVRNSDVACDVSSSEPPLRAGPGSTEVMAPRSGPDRFSLPLIQIHLRRYLDVHGEDVLLSDWDKAYKADHKDLVKLAALKADVEEAKKRDTNGKGKARAKK